MSGATGLLRRLVRLDTRDPPGREIEIATLVHRRLAGAGLASELDEFAPGRANVLARIAGAGRRPAIVFSAHFDTLPLGGRPWSRDPFGAEIDGGRLYGRGAADMKGGLAAMVVAAERLAASAGGLGGDVVLAFTAGESSNCLGARRLAETRALEGAGALLVSEPSSMEVLLAEKGALWLRLAAHGELGHRSGDDGAMGGGRSAIERAMEALAALRGFALDTPDHPLLGAPSLSVGTVRGGAAVNLTPDRCEAEIDIRLPPGAEPEAAERAVRALVGDDLDMERIDYKPPVETPADHPFARLCLDAVSRERGVAAVPGGASYYSDATVLTPAFGLPMAIVGPGALGMSGRTDEYVETADVERAAALYERIARDWLDPARPAGA